MERPLWIEYEGVFHHVLQRGENRTEFGEGKGVASGAFGAV